MFDDTQNENLGDLERLQKVFDNLPDEKLIRRLKEKRGKVRNEWSVEAMWNSFIASFIFDHDSIASLLREMFDTLVKYMYENLNGFGEIMAADGKAIQSYAGRISKKNSGNKGERDADCCRKEYTITKPNGEKVVKTKKWFGFRLHLLSDATYELPVDYEVTKASNSELKETEKLLDNIKEKNPKKLEKCIT